MTFHLVTQVPSTTAPTNVTKEAMPCVEVDARATADLQDGELAQETIRRLDAFARAASGGPLAADVNRVVALVKATPGMHGASLLMPLDSTCVGKLLDLDPSSSKTEGPSTKLTREREGTIGDGDDEGDCEAVSKRASKRNKRDQLGAGVDDDGHDDRVDGDVGSERDGTGTVATPPAKATGAPGADKAAAQSKKTQSDIKKVKVPYRGVTQHARSGRFECHIWVGKPMNKQVYLGGYETAELAAEAYDIVAVKLKGDKAKTNFELSNYRDALRVLDGMSFEMVVASVKRESDTFSRGSIKYRGVTKSTYKDSYGAFEARVGVFGRHTYVGTYQTALEAARACVMKTTDRAHTNACGHLSCFVSHTSLRTSHSPWLLAHCDRYDRGLVRLRGTTCVTNFPATEYRVELADNSKLVELLNRGHKPVKSMLEDMGERDNVRAFEVFVRGGWSALEAHWKRLGVHVF